MPTVFQRLCFFRQIWLSKTIKQKEMIFGTKTLRKEREREREREREIMIDGLEETRSQ